jgi:hypothetical protein
MHAIEIDDEQMFSGGVADLDFLLNELEMEITNLQIFKFFLENRWYIIAGIIEFIIVSYLLTQLLFPLFRLGRDIMSLSEKEKELVQIRISTEKQYFTRKIDENTFNAIMIKKQEEVLKTRSTLDDRKKVRSTLFKTQLSPVTLLKWMTAGPRRLIGRSGKGKEKDKSKEKE